MHTTSSPSIAESVPTLENGGLRLVTDAADAPDGRLEATFRLRDANGRTVRPSRRRCCGSRGSGQGEHHLAGGRGCGSHLGHPGAAARDVRVLYLNGERWDDYALGPHVMPSTVWRRQPRNNGPPTLASRSTRARSRSRPGSRKHHALRLPEHVLENRSSGRLEIHFFPTRAARFRRFCAETSTSPRGRCSSPTSRKRLDRFADGTPPPRPVRAHRGGAMLRFGSDPRRVGDPLCGGHRAHHRPPVDRSTMSSSAAHGSRARTSFRRSGPAAEDVPLERPDRDRARRYLRSRFRKGAIRDHRTKRRADDATLDKREGRRHAPTSPDESPVTSPRSGSPPRCVSGPFRIFRPRCTAVTSIWRSRPRKRLNPQRASERWAGLVDPWFDALARLAAQSSGPHREARDHAEMEKIWTLALPRSPFFRSSASMLPQGSRAFSHPIGFGAFPGTFTSGASWSLKPWRASDGTKNGQIARTPNKGEGGRILIQTRNRIWPLLSLFTLLSLVVGACTQQAAAVRPPREATPTRTASS